MILIVCRYDTNTMSIWYKQYVYIILIVCQYDTNYMSIWYKQYVHIILIVCQYHTNSISKWYKKYVFMILIVCQYGTNSMPINFSLRLPVASFLHGSFHLMFSAQVPFLMYNTRTCSRCLCNNQTMHSQTTDTVQLQFLLWLTGSVLTLSIMQNNSWHEHKRRLALLFYDIMQSMKLVNSSGEEQVKKLFIFLEKTQYIQITVMQHRS